MPKAHVTVHSSRGAYSFVCTETQRGTEKQKYVFDVYGVGAEPDLTDSQFYFDFNGQQYGAGLEVVARYGKACKVRMNCIITDPEFWK